MYEKIGIKTEEAAEAVVAIVRLLPPPGQEDIERIKRNPTLSWWQKKKTIYNMERTIAKAKQKCKQSGRGL